MKSLYKFQFPYAIKVAVVACGRHAWAQATQNPRKEREIPLPNELSATDSSWEGRISFLKGVILDRSTGIQWKSIHPESI